MPFSRFFGRGRDKSSTPVGSADRNDIPSVTPESIDVDDIGDADEVEHSPESHAPRSWRERADAALPTGASTGSKRAAALWGDDADASLPTHFASARGCHVVAVDGTEYVDCTMGLGSVALGYAEPRITRAVVDAASEGNVSALSSWREVELAERLRVVIPCAERVQFFKSGAEATAAAVRLARTYTGRERIVMSGYFGWHDWSADAEGIPPTVRKSTHRVPFDDITALEQAVSDAGSALAAIVLEPVVEHLPSTEWLERARELCDANGAALVFDEIKTGFRVAPGGYQEVCGVTPDLATFGKAMSNGYPLSAVVGLSTLMDAARRTWISSTLASEATALAAALAVLDWHDEADICASLADTGRELRSAFDRAIVASGIAGVETEGVDTMFMLKWDHVAREAEFVRQAAHSGVIVKRGAYNFAAVAHDDDALRAVESAVSEAFVRVVERERSR